MDPRLIQKQVKDNCEDLNVFMKDLKVWEKDMKRKDRELLKNEDEPQDLPPIRGKKKKPKAENREEDKEKSSKTDTVGSPNDDSSKTETSVPKKISGIDYAAWNRFDVDKACAELDVEESEESESDPEDDQDVDDTARLREEATYEKEKGNQFVRNGKYADAIPCYTRAIECYPYDAIYYANRGLCFIKTKDFESAEADCSKSVQLDESYVKAYLRRATARIALGRYFEAKDDLEKAMEYEPMNTDAKAELIKLEKTIKVSKLKKPDAGSAGSSAKMTLLDRGSGEPAKINPGSKTTEKLNFLDISSRPEQKICIQNEPEEQTVLVKDETPKEVKIVELTEPSAGPSGTKKIPVKTGSPTKKIPVVNKVPASVKAASEAEFIPAKPKSSVDFLLGWRRVKANANQSFVYLKQIKGPEIPFIFQESLESSTLSDIITILKNEFLSRKEPVYQYLLGFSKVKRLSALIMFMSDVDKKSLSLLLENSIKSGECTEDEGNTLKQKFEL